MSVLLWIIISYARIVRCDLLASAMRQAKSNMEVYGICGWDKGCDGCTLLVIFHAAVINPKPLAWFVFIDREKVLVARSTVIHTGVAIDIAFVSIYPNNHLTITYGFVAAIAVSGMNTLAVVVGIRVMQYTIVNYLKKD